MAEFPAAIRDKIEVEPSGISLVVLTPLSSHDLAALRVLAVDDTEWQQCVDRIALESSLLPTGAFPATLWGEFLDRLRAGDEEAWTSFVNRYRLAIGETIRAIFRRRNHPEVEELVAEFLAWLYLPSQAGSSNGAIAQRLQGVQLTDDAGTRVFRFRGWLRATLHGWLKDRAKSESRRIRREQVAAERNGLEWREEYEARIDQALVCHAADEVIAELHADSTVHYRALMDLLSNESLQTTVAWLRAESLPASLASASRTRAKAARLFRDRLVEHFREQIGGDEAELALHLEALAAHLGQLSAATK